MVEDGAGHLTHRTWRVRGAYRFLRGEGGWGDTTRKVFEKAVS